MHAPDARRRGLGFEFLKPPRSGRDVLVVEDLDAPRGGQAPARRRVVRDRARRARRARRAQRLRQDDAARDAARPTLAGRRVLRLGHGVQAAYFSQHEAELDERGSVLDAAMSGTGLKRPEAQALLGRFLFSGWDEHEKRVGALSGGERRRLALAIAVASGANFLVLDEPTNHLDLESREALEAALDAFPGTVLLVSHDRALLDAVADRMLAVEDRAIVLYPGGWADYVRAQERTGRRAPPPHAEGRSARSRNGPSKANPGRLSSSRRRSRAPRHGSPTSSEKLAADWGDVALAHLAQKRRETSRRADHAVGIAVRSERIDRLGDRVEHEDRLVRARVGERPQARGDPLRRRPSRLTRAARRRRDRADEHAHAALRSRPGRGRRRAPPRRPRGQRRRSPPGVAGLDVPGVPRVDARDRRRQHPRPVGADDQRRRRGRRQQHRVATVEARRRADALAGQQPRTISNASSNRAKRWSNGMPNASNSVRFQPAPSATRADRPRARRPLPRCGRGFPAGGTPCRRRAARASRARSRRPAPASSVQQSHGPRSGRPSPR